jgi:hypothetical protein
MFYERAESYGFGEKFSALNAEHTARHYDSHQLILLNNALLYKRA